MLALQNKTATQDGRFVIFRLTRGDIHRDFKAEAHVGETRGFPLHSASFAMIGQTDAGPLRGSSPARRRAKPRTPYRRIFNRNRLLWLHDWKLPLRPFNLFIATFIDFQNRQAPYLFCQGHLASRVR